MQTIIIEQKGENMKTTKKTNTNNCGGSKRSCKTSTKTRACSSGGTTNKMSGRNSACSSSKTMNKSTKSSSAHATAKKSTSVKSQLKTRKNTSKSRK